VINLLKKLKTPLKVVFFISFALILIIGGLYLYAFLSPKISIKTSGKYYIYDKYNELVYQGSSSSEWINLDDIADNMKKAIISTEDKRFYKHKGFDYPRIMKAIINNIKSKHVVEGASTISQQYVKHLYLTFDKTRKRKMEEAMLTLELEVH
jgi:membrane peptidoglycan carboxypeptidase